MEVYQIVQKDSSEKTVLVSSTVYTSYFRATSDCEDFNKMKHDDEHPYVVTTLLLNNKE